MDEFKDEGNDISKSGKSYNQVEYLVFCVCVTLSIVLHSYRADRLIGSTSHLSET